MAIDHDGLMPVWRQLANELRERIRAGELSGRLPAELRLAQEYGLSHGTVRKALALLRQEGLIRTDPGWGSVVINRDG